MEIREAKSIQEVEDYYFSTKLNDISEIEVTGEKVINLGIGNPDLPPSQSTIAALQISASQDGNHGYQNYDSSIELLYEYGTFLLFFLLIYFYFLSNSYEIPYS